MGHTPCLDRKVMNSLSTARIRVFALFSLGYFVSYVFRGVNLGLAPFLSRDLGLSATDLGTLTSLYFLAFAGAQIPAGVLLDRFGPRRVTAALLAVAAAGAVAFATADSLSALMLGRLLIGAGVSVCLAGAFKALAQNFPVSRLPLLNGLVMAIGGLGGAAVGTPLTWLLGFSDWRTVCVGLAAFTLLSAAAIWAGAPAGVANQAHAARARETMGSQFRALADIFRQQLFWRTALFASMTQAVFYAMQSLWVGAFLRDVSRLTPATAAGLVSVLAFAMMAGCVGFGTFARSLERRGLSVRALCGLGMLVFVAVQILIMARVALPASFLWAAYGFFGGTGILSYAVLTESFAPHLTGRVNTSLNLVLFMMVFAFQIGVGAVLSLWRPIAGHYPAAAHLCAWAILVALQLLSAAWYFMPLRAGAAVPRSVA